MRIMLCTRPFESHAQPLIALARALGRDPGTRVVMTSAREFRHRVEAAGVEWRPGGPHPYDAVGGQYGAGHISRCAAQLLDVAADFGPDLVVREPSEFGAVVAAEAIDRPHVTVGLSLFGPSGWWGGFLRDGLDRVRAEHDLEPDPTHRNLYPYLFLDPVPPWFQTPLVAGLDVHRFVRSGLVPDVPPVHPWEGLRPLDARPLVYVTRGTIYNRAPGLWRTAITAMQRAGLNVVATTGPGVDPRTLAVLGDARTAISSWIPQDAVLPWADVCLCHGGYHTVMGALLAGVPVVCMPMGSDQLSNAQRCAQLGVGVVLDPETTGAAAIQDAVWSVMGDPDMRAGARRFARQTRRLPPWDYGVELVRWVARTGRPVSELPAELEDSWTTAAVATA